jgi:hypothetical protein
MSPLKTAKMGETVRFEAELAPDGSLSMPASSWEAISSEAGTVEGTAGGFPFRAPFDESGRIQFSEALQRAIGAKAGNKLAVEITRVGEEPEVRVPEDLRAALSRTPAAQSLWAEITPMARREWVRWIASAKQAETRARRIEVGLDKLTKGMRRPCCFPGLNWVTKDLVGPEETWGPLPGK